VVVVKCKARLQGPVSSEDVRQPVHSAAAAAAAGNDDTVSLIAQLRARCEQLSQKCNMYEQEVNRLNAKLERFIHEVRQHRMKFIAGY